MKIQYQNGEEADTSKMPDLQAHIYESIQGLIEVFKKYDATFYLAVGIPQGDNMALTGAQRFKSTKELSVILDYMETHFLKKVSLKLMPLEEGEIEESEEEETEE